MDPPSPADSSRTPRGEIGFARWWAIGLTTLLIATYPLWIPLFESSYPRVAWVSLPSSKSIIAAVESFALIVMLIGLIEVIVTGRGRWAWWLVAASLVSLILLDSHRLQPWAYQSVLISIGLAGLTWREARRWIAAVAISIYAYSAMGKFDYQFVHTVGHDFVRALAAPLGGVSDAIAVRLAFLLPSFELLVAVLLAVPMTRRIGGCGAMLMHLSLIGLLGPWALNHSLGVLTWNTLLAGQAWILFVRPTETLQETTPSPASGDRAFVYLTRGIRAIFLVALLAPLGERFGYWDHWTSWALYSPHNSRVEIQVHRSAAERLPQPFSNYLVESQNADGWYDLDMERFSLERRRVPVYPQARYQLDLAVELANRFQLEDAIRVRHKSMSDRWSGSREETLALGVDEILKLRNR